MKSDESSVLFQEDGGQLLAVEVQRSSRRPIISRLHRALMATGVIVTTYQAQTNGGGLRERIELANRDGQRLSGIQSSTVRTAVLPLALGDDESST